MTEKLSIAILPPTYHMHDDAYLKVFTLNSRFFDALLKVPLFGVGSPAYYMGL